MRAKINIVWLSHIDTNLYIDISLGIYDIECSALYKRKKKNLQAKKIMMQYINFLCIHPFLFNYYLYKQRQRMLL